MYIRINTQIEQKATTESVISNALCPCCHTKSEIVLCDFSAQQQLRSGTAIGPTNHSKCSICNSCGEIIIIPSRKYAQIMKENSPQTYEQIIFQVYENLMLKNKMLPPYSKLSSKSFSSSFLMVLFLGLFGGYNFYMGKIKSFFIQLGLWVLSIISLILFIVFMPENVLPGLIMLSCAGFMVNLFWWIIDLISVLSYSKDENGDFIMPKKSFQKKKNKWINRKRLTIQEIFPNLHQR